MTSDQTHSIARKFFSMTLFALALAHCGDRGRCDQLREELYQQKTAWAQCTSDEECFPLAGNPRDCTGVLTCPFAVHRAHRQEAEWAQLNIGTDSQDCHVCAVPNCTNSDRPYCEPLTHQCVMAELFDAGPAFGPPSVRDVGPPPPDDDIDAAAE